MQLPRLLQRMPVGQAAGFVVPAAQSVPASWHVLVEVAQSSPGGQSATVPHCPGARHCLVLAQYFGLAQSAGVSQPPAGMQLPRVEQVWPLSQSAVTPHLPVRAHWPEARQCSPARQSAVALQLGSRTQILFVHTKWVVQSA